MTFERLTKIRRVSNFLRSVILVFALIAGAIMIALFLDPSRMTIDPKETQMNDQLLRSVLGKRALIVAAAVTYGGLFLLLFRLFSLYAQGIIFSEKNIWYLRMLGTWMLVCWIARIPVQWILYSVIPSSQSAETVVTILGSRFTVNPGWHGLSLAFDGLFFGGILVFLLGWIMDEGRKLKEEQELVI